jgi:hypothetical protein
MGVEGLVFRCGVNAVEVRGQDESDGEKSSCTVYRCAISLSQEGNHSKINASVRGNEAFGIFHDEIYHEKQI